MNIKEQLTELGNKYIKLEKELEEGVKILENYKNNLVRLLKEDERTDYKSDDENLWINMKEREKFDSKKFKEENSEMYEEFRIERSGKKFNKKELEQNRPDIYKKYCKTIIAKFEVKRIKE
jgi:hypothetical protein